jgi:hypothetical protein
MTITEFRKSAFVPQIACGSGGGGGGNSGIEMNRNGKGNIRSGGQIIGGGGRSGRGGINAGASGCETLGGATVATAGVAAAIPNKTLQSSVVKGVATTAAAGMAMTYDHLCR